jgi:hypothetical protein
MGDEIAKELELNMAQVKHAKMRPHRLLHRRLCRTLKKRFEEPVIVFNKSERFNSGEGRDDVIHIFRIVEIYLPVKRGDIWEANGSFTKMRQK